MWKAHLSGLWVFAIIGFLLGGEAASAHQLRIFAYVEGDEICGEVFFRDGTPAASAKVTAFGPQGQTLSQTVSDSSGQFRLKVVARCDHRLVADAGDLHVAEFVVSADELPPLGAASDSPSPAESSQALSAGTPSAETFSAASNPQAASPEISGAQMPANGSGIDWKAKETESIAANGRTSHGAARGVPHPESKAGITDTGTVTAKPTDLAELRSELAALRRQIIQLREDLNRFQTDIRFQDILGGIGYILGLMGLGYYLLQSAKGAGRGKNRGAESIPAG